MTEYRRLDDICNINMGQSPASDSYNEDGDGLPFFQGNADFGELYPEVRIWCNAPTKIVEPETLLISVRAPIGALNFSRERSCIGRGLAGITPMPGIELKYVYYCFKGKNAELNAKGTGSTFKAIAKAALGETPVRMISLVEQQEIIQTIDKLSEVIRQRKQQLADLDTLIKARFVEMFGEPETNPMQWNVAPLKQLMTVEPQNGLYKPQSDYVQDGSGTPILRIDAFYDGRVTDFSLLKRLICSDTEKQRYLLCENDIVINRVNSIEYLGKCAHITGMAEDTVFESNMMRFHLDEKVINAEFATHLLCSKYIYNQILRRAKKAVNQASINQGDVQSFVMLVPPLELQNQFAAFVAQIDKSKAVVQKALDEAQTLFDSLMQQYFG